MIGKGRIEIFPFLMIYAALTVLATILALLLCDRVEQAIAVIALWPVALPLLVYREVKRAHVVQKHQHRLEDKRREMEVFEQMMEDEKKVDHYLEE